MISLLPQEILIDILSRLPAKSLVQCTCLSKSWYSLFTNPTFITKHLNQTSNRNGHLLVVRHYPWQPDKKERLESYSLRLDNETLDEYRKLQPPHQTKFTNSYYKIVGSCNGLLCLVDMNIISLWNPTINKFISLPSSPFQQCVIGFGFDSKTNDHKVLRITYPHSRCSPVVDIYSLCMRSWRSITVPLPPYFFHYCNSPHAFINGAIHWVAIDHGKRSPNACLGSPNVIAVFDISDEVFREEMLLPEIIACRFWIQTCIGVFKGSLSIFQYDCASQAPQLCSIWVMKEYGAAKSWTKQLNIDIRNGCGRVLFFRKNGEIILRKHGNLYSYDPESKKIKVLEICDYMHSPYVDTYMESLFMLTHVN